MTFGIVEGGYILYQHNASQKATQMGARYISTRPIVSGLEDCMISTNADAGTDCANVANSASYSQTCTGTAPGICDATVMNNALAEMQKSNPNIEASNLTVVISGTGLGYVGRRKPVPAITVSVENMTYDYVAVGQLLNLGSVLGLDSAQTTVIAEDIGNGGG